MIYHHSLFSQMWGGPGGVHLDLFIHACVGLGSVMGVEPWDATRLVFEMCTPLFS